MFQKNNSIFSSGDARWLRASTKSETRDTNPLTSALWAGNKEDFWVLAGGFASRQYPTPLFFRSPAGWLCSFLPCRHNLTGIDLVIVQITSCRYIQVADGIIGTNADAFLATSTRVCMVDMSMAMFEEDYFSQNVVRACFHAFPTGLAPAGVDRNKLRAQMTWCGQACSDGHRFSSWQVSADRQPDILGYLHIPGKGSLCPTVQPAGF